MMSGKHVISARQTVKYSCFSSFNSCSRLRNVQSILRENAVSKEVDQTPDAILCILGVDCRFDEGHRELGNYLLFDYFQQKADPRLREDDDETFEDILLLITQSAVHVYCNPDNYSQLLPYVAHWPNLRLHCLNKAEYDGDSDFAEDFKVLSFIEMCRDSQFVGMPFGTRNHPVPFDPFLIEKWPIVQASALEDYGGGGFFTLRHKVVDISERLWSLYDSVDPVYLEAVITKDLPLIEKQWNNMLTNINLAFSSNSAKELTENEVAEPLLSFFAFKNLTRKKSQESTNMFPYCLFGQHSAASDRSDKSSQRTIGSAGINNSLAKHMVCQVVASNITCSRTYFFAGGHTQYPMTGGVVQAPRQPKTDIELLEGLYKAVVVSVLKAVDTYIYTGSVIKSKDSCLKSMKELCAEDFIDTGLELLKTGESACFFLHGVDGLGNHVTLGEECRSETLKLIGLHLVDVPSIEHPGKTLGSIEFSETFVNSMLHVQSDKTITSDPRSLILTSRIPRSVTWELSQSKENIQNHLQQLLHSVAGPFGELLIDGVQCSSLGSKETGDITDGTLYICDEAVLFVDSGSNMAVFPLSYVEEATLIDGGSVSGLSILSVTYRHSLQQYLPLSYHSNDDVILFIFTPKTKAHRLFYSQVVSKWQSRKMDPVLKTSETIPDHMEELYAGLQVKFSLNNNDAAQSEELQIASAGLEGFRSFLDHLATSSALKDAPIPAKDLPIMLLEQAEATESEADENMIIVNLLTGVPGSHQEELCNTLVNLAKEHNRWMILNPPLDSGEFFKPQVIHDSLTSVYNAARKQKQSVRAATGGRKQMRALLVVPPFTSTAAVVHCILNHPDPEIASHLTIGSVTCCLDPLNTFLSNRLTFPLLQDQCMMGWVNNVLFTGSTEGKSQDVEFCEDLIRRTNPDVTFILAEKGEIPRSSDAEAILSETAFMEPDLVRVRHLVTPGWWTGEGLSCDLYPPFNQVCVHFYQPLERHRFIAGLQPIHSSANDDGKLADMICHIRGTTKFTDSEQLSEVYFTTMSGYLSLVPTPMVPPARPPPPTSGRGRPAPPIAGGDNHCGSSLLFIGAGLQESHVKAWLRTCAKQRPLKQQLKTPQSLQKEEMQRIHEEHHLDPLPEGWFYNGFQYVSLMGEKQLKHPNMDSFVEQYLQSSNQKIEEINKEIDSVDYHDLFQQIA